MCRTHETVVTYVAMIVASLALLANIGSASLPATVTYTNPGARLEVVLPELSMATGLKLVPADEMKGIPVVLRLHGAPVQEALEKLAFAARGVWSVENGVHVLHVDAVAIHKEREAAVAKHAAVIHGILAELRRGSEPPDPAHPPSSHDGSDVDRTPPYVALANIISFLDESLIANLRTNQRVVYSTRPRPLQHSLPPVANTIFAAMIKGLNSEQAGKSDYADTQIVGVPYKTNVVITPERGSQSGDEMLWIVVEVFDRNGALITSQRAPGMERSSPPKEEKSYEAEEAKPLLLDPVYLSILHFWHEHESASPAALKFVKSPLEHDPIESEGATLVAYAELHHTQLAASISDPMTFSWTTNGFPINSEFIHRMLEYQNALPSDGWILLRREITTVLSDGDPGAIMDRRQLQRLVDALPGLRKAMFFDQIRGARLGDSQLGFASGSPLPQYELLPPTLDVFPDGESAALAALTDDQIRTLLSGKRVKLSETPVAFQRHFEEETHGTRGHLVSFLSEDPSPNPYKGPSAITTARGWNREFTEVADSAIPHACYLRLLRSDTYAAEFSKPGWSAPGRIDLRQLAEEIVSNQDFDQIRVCTEHNFELRYYLTPHLYFSDKGSTYERPDNAPLVSVKHLPAAMQAALKPYLAEVREWHNLHGK